jgi:hypothetical protein
MIKIVLSLFVLFFIYFMYMPDDVVVVKIYDVGKSQDIDKPFKRHAGWVRMVHEVSENTASDTVALGGSTLIPPGWTGVIYANDHYNVEPTKGIYKAVRPGKGSITLKYSVTY